MTASFDFLNQWFEDADKRVSWGNLIVALVFSIADTVGRYAGSKVNIGASCVIILSLTRVLFIFTTIGTAVVWEPKAIFGADWFKITNLLLFALSNGFVST